MVYYSSYLQYYIHPGCKKHFSYKNSLSLCSRLWYSNPYISLQLNHVDIRYFKLWVLLKGYKDIKINKFDLIPQLEMFVFYF